MADPEAAPRAWKIRFARAARQVIGLDLTVQTMREDRRSLAELLDFIEERSLLIILEGPEQTLGLMVFSPTLLASVIEVQTVGQITAAPPLPRKPTRTDAVLSARLVDAALAMLDEALTDSDARTWAGGYRYASFIEDLRPLGTLLEDTGYRLLTSDVSIAGGLRNGTLTLALPAQGRGPAPTLPTAEPEPDAQWSGQLSSVVMEAEVTLNAVLTRIRVPLLQARKLVPGTVIHLPEAQVDKVTLVSSDGRPAGAGRLGQHRGMRALKMAQSDPPPTTLPVGESQSAQDASVALAALQQGPAR